jgi:hypothetical protein
MKKITLIAIIALSLYSCSSEIKEDMTTNNEFDSYHESRNKGHLYVQYYRRSSDWIHAPHCECRARD